LKNLSVEQTKELLPDNLILLGYRGSIAHGTYVPNSKPNSIDDKDIQGVYIAPIEHYFGLKHYDFKEKFIGEWDAVSYELKKFVSLLLKGNPNVLGLLWLDDKHYIHKTAHGQMLINHRDIFISKKIYHSFTGYAWGQFSRMTHYKFEGYMGEKRKALVDKYGYDCKNASHLVRLLEMGIEIMTEGKIYVERPNAQKLLSIKNGEWSLEQVKKEAHRLFEIAHETYIKSTLPNEPDYGKVEALLIDILKKEAL